MSLIRKISVQMIDIDKIDRKILSILQADGRIANVELAERIDKRAETYRERLRGRKRARPVASLSPVEWLKAQEQVGK